VGYALPIFLICLQNNKKVKISAKDNSFYKESGETAAKEYSDFLIQ